MESEETVDEASKKCLVCKKEAEEKGVECDFCGGWMHLKCLGLHPESKSIENPNLMVFCNECKRDFVKYKKGETKVKVGGDGTQKGVKVLADKVNQVIEMLNPLQQSTDERFNRLENKVDELAKAIPKVKVGDSNTDGATTGMSYAAAVKKGVPDDASNATKSAIREINQEDLQRKSAVIKGLPEEGRDLEMANALVKELDISAYVTQAFRMGMKKNSSGAPQPRLLKIHLPSSSCLRSILKESRALKDSLNFHKCFIRRSMTIHERQELSKAYEDRNKLNGGQGPESTTKYCIVRETLMKFVGCTRDETGKLGRGSRDVSFNINGPNEEEQAILEGNNNDSFPEIEELGNE